MANSILRKRLLGSSVITGVTTNIETLLNNLPQVSPDFGLTSINGTAGAANVDLRGLGSKRTLVLIDGRRLMPGDPLIPVPDLDTIPAALVERVDVLTGGASAVYGSDAVAGVVNFIMKKDFVGARLDAQYSFYQDNNDDSAVDAVLAQGIGGNGTPLDGPHGSTVGGGAWDVTAIVGVNAPDGKGNITAYVGYRHVDPILSATRDYAYCEIGAIASGSATINGRSVYDTHLCFGSANSTYSQDQVRDLLRQVTQRQPRFATGWAKLALAASSARHTLPADQAAAAERESRAAAQRALQLDPHNGIPYIALNDLLPSPGHLFEHQNLILKGLSVSPDNAVLNLREGDLLSQVGRVAEALVYGRRAEKLDPLNPIMAGYLTGFLLADGLLGEARAENDRAATLWPDGGFKGARIAIEARFGDPDKALALLDDPKSRPADFEPSDIDDFRQRCMIRKSHDRALLARYASEQLAQLAAGKINPSAVVSRLSQLGAVDAAFEAAGKATPADTLETEPLFRPANAGMRRDPRFMPLMAKVGLLNFWRKTGKWPDFCEAADRPYDCRAVAAKLAPS